MHVVGGVPDLRELCVVHKALDAVVAEQQSPCIRTTSLVNRINSNRPRD